MADPYLVPCLVTLRAEFNSLSPGRDKGADGWIGDTAHQSHTSDHNPQADGRVLAIDIDSTGPWPGGVTDFNAFNMTVESLRGDDRLEYIIWNRRICSRDQGWTWRTYTGSADPHTNHAHFSARHDHAGNTSTAPWGLTQENDDMLVKKGDSGEEVKFWQFVLNEVADAKLTVDGDYGTSTEAAVNADRKARGQGPNPAISGWHAFMLLRDLAAENAAAGPQGKTGPAGPQGPAGSQGPKGDKGDSGAGDSFSGTLTVTGGQLDVTATA
jgi:hypothetical protein